MQKAFPFITLLFCLIMACDPPPKQNHKLNNQMKFKSNELLYFNNVRRVAYEVLKLNGPLKIYRHKEVDENAFLKPVIIINQNADEAYLLIDYPVLKPGSIIQIMENQEIQLKNHEAHFEAFKAIHSAAKSAQQPLSIQLNGNQEELDIKEIQNAWSYMLADYYRLTGKPLK